MAVGGAAVDEDGNPLITNGGVPVDTGATSAGVGGTAVGASVCRREKASRRCVSAAARAAAPAAPSAPAGSTPLAVPTVPNAPA